MPVRWIFIVCVVLVVSQSSDAQSVVGFWTVDEVKVGDRILTPVAKWFRYHSDHTYQAGNGWMQNDIGTWKYDKTTREFLPESRNGKDEFGPFKVEFENQKMTWIRMEDGALVVVSLSKITAMPMSPRDSIAGNWELVSVMKGDQDITRSFDPDDKEKMVVRWTGTYHKTNPDGSQSTGYWHMDAHKPEFHLIDFNRETDFQVFTVSFKGDLLTMNPKTGQGLHFIYGRK